MEACISCSFAKYSTDVGFSFIFVWKRSTRLWEFCNKDFANRLRRTKISPKSTVKDEKHLLLLRAGIFDKERANLK